MWVAEVNPTPQRSPSGAAPRMTTFDGPAKTVAYCLAALPQETGTPLPADGERAARAADSGI